MDNNSVQPLPSTILMPTRDIDKSPILEAYKIGIDFGGLVAVDEFSIAVGRTEICGIIGPNGAGKTTVFNLLTNVYQPTRGIIMLDGKNTAGLSPHQVNRLGIARTFQNIRLFNNMSVIDNIKVGFSNQIKCSMLESLLRFPRYFKTEAQSTNRALELLNFFNMESLAYEKAGNLSYGAQRRLEILRALATNPGILLLDEPAAGMNPSETDELMGNIKRIRDTFQIAIMLIEHDMNLVMGVCEVVGVLNYGKIIAKGTPDQIKSNPLVIEAYLGNSEN